MEPAATGKLGHGAAEPLERGHQGRLEAHNQPLPAELQVPEQQQGPFGPQVGRGEGEAGIEAKRRS
jgi:hypothetical protein